MTTAKTPRTLRSSHPGYGPAAPLWRFAPTSAGDGRSLADFMMLIPGLGKRPPIARAQVAASIRTVCASFGEQVVFADINYAINVLWVSVQAEPGLGGRVAARIRQEVPEALLVGGQLGTVAGMPTRRAGGMPWYRRLRRLASQARKLLGAPG